MAYLTAPRLEMGPPPPALARMSAPDRSLAPGLEDVLSSLSSPPWRRNPATNPFGELIIDPHLASGSARPPPASEVARETSSAGAGAAPGAGAPGCEPGRTRQRAAAAAATHGPCRRAAASRARPQRRRGRATRRRAGQSFDFRKDLWFAQARNDGRRLRQPGNAAPARLGAQFGEWRARALRQVHCRLRHLSAYRVPAERRETGSPFRSRRSD